MRLRVAMLTALVALACVPQAAAAPALQLPFKKGATWWVNGPHSHDGKTGKRNSVDIGPGGATSATVLAAAGGIAHVVTCSGGKYVTIDHGDGWSTRYRHLGSVAQGIDGKRLSAGDVVGKTSSTCGGSTRFFHVHFGLFKNGEQQPLDGVSIGGYTIHAGKGQYSGYWTRNKDGAKVHTTGSDGFAHCCLTNDQSVTTTSNNPIGNYEGASSPSGGEVRVRGWAYDPNAKTAAVQIHAYVGGRAGAGGAKGYKLGPAKKKRDDVARSRKGIGPNHGFDVTFTTGLRGRKEICVYAIDIGPGTNKLLGCKAVEIRLKPGENDVIGTYTPPLVGDYNGDGFSDIHWYHPGEGGTMWFGTSTMGVFDKGYKNLVTGTYSPPLPGDYNGDGFDDIFFYKPGEGGDSIWFGTATKGQFLKP